LNLLNLSNLRNLSSRLPPSFRTRFAPSPTGYLHLGHVVNAIYVWGIARALNGTVLLRIEDHDRERSRQEYEAAILADLEWLGFVPDADERVASVALFVRQSERTAVYEDALGALRAKELVYACRCSRREIGDVGMRTGREPRYPGTCREARLPDGSGRGLRLRMEPGIESFDDGVVGPQAQDPSAQCGDVLVRDRVGQWTYQFAASVDDVAQNIGLVVRGADLLSSTGRQIRLMRLLGRETPPVYVHHPLLYGAPGVKLSKSNRDAGVRELRAAGLGPADVVGLAAAQVGLLPASRPLRVDELACALGID
jgi:glutamyl-tRNA synthetase/glutamyl-Q tRNA(Asp) synthetase